MKHGEEGGLRLIVGKSKMSLLEREQKPLYEVSVNGRQLRHFRI